MTRSYATNFFHKQEFQERFKFYFKQAECKTQPMLKRDQLLHDLVRPRLKIAIVTEVWPLAWAASSYSLLQLCQGLQHFGHKILLIKPQQKQDNGHFKSYKECLIKLDGCSESHRLKLDGSQHSKMSTALADFLPHIIHIATEGPLGLAALQIAKVMHIPIASGFYSPFSTFSRFFDLAFLVKPIQRYLQWFYNSVQLMCVPSLEIEQALQKIGVTCPIYVFDQGVDLSLFHPQFRCERLRQDWGADKDTIVMLYPAELVSSPQLLSEIVQSALKHNHKVKLVVIGDRQNLSFSTDIDHKAQIIFIDQLTERALVQVYASADILIFSSQLESLNHIIFKAMASGLAIATDRGYYAQFKRLSTQPHWLIPLDELPKQLSGYVRLRDMGKQARQNIEQCGWLYSIQQIEQRLYWLKDNQSITLV